MKSGSIKKVIVTGDARFIGSALIRQFINQTDVTVINIDGHTYVGKLESLGSVSDNPRHIFEHADICDRSAVERIFQ